MEIDGLRRSKLHLYRIIIGLNKNLLNLSDSATKLLSRIFIHVEKNSRREERRLGVHQIFTEKSIDSMWVKEGIYGGELAQRLEGKEPRAIHPRSIFLFFIKTIQAARGDRTLYAAKFRLSGLVTSPGKTDLADRRFRELGRNLICVAALSPSFACQIG